MSIQQIRKDQGVRNHKPGLKRYVHSWHRAQGTGHKEQAKLFLVLEPCAVSLEPFVRRPLHRAARVIHGG
jgi:hypothetical protein